MRILAISDVSAWTGYEDLIADYEPEVITLGGDLTSDGFAEFWTGAFELVPGFVRARKRLMVRLGVTWTRGGIYEASRRSLHKFWEELDLLEREYQKSPAFRVAKNKQHVKPFYRFLRSAGKRARVLVVMGDHDLDFPGDYSARKIELAAGCREISGKLYRVRGRVFLGLGFRQTHYVTQLKELVQRYRGLVDVVIAHVQQSRLPLIGELQADLIVRGHFGSGKYLVSGIPAVFTAGATYSLIELPKKGFPRVRQFVGDLNGVTGEGGVQELRHGSCRPWFSDRTEFERYPWLQPWPRA